MDKENFWKEGKEKEEVEVFLIKLISNNF